MKKFFIYSFYYGAENEKLTALLAVLLLSLSFGIGFGLTFASPWAIPALYMSAMAGTRIGILWSPTGRESAIAALKEVE